jgi:hypothetical protein
VTVTLSEDAQNAACNAVVAVIDRAGSAGSMRILGGAGEILCVIALVRPAFSPAQEGIAEANGLPRTGVGTDAAGRGIAPSKYEVLDGDGSVVWAGDVPGGMVLDGGTIAAKQIVSIVSWRHAQPAR